MRTDPTPKYSCSKCGRAIIILKDSEPIRACHCKDAHIIANGKATLKASVSANA